MKSTYLKIFGVVIMLGMMSQAQAAFLEKPSIVDSVQRFVVSDVISIKLGSSFWNWWNSWDWGSWWGSWGGNHDGDGNGNGHDQPVSLSEAYGIALLLPVLLGIGLILRMNRKQ
jgi:hypothetical protein